MLSTEAKSTKLVRVAVGVVRKPNGEVLIALRAAHQHQGNLWEFPGGKIEPNESSAQALVRELKEEVGIDVLATEPLINIEHHYSDKSVLLEVLSVTDFRGTAHGREGQSVKWVEPKALSSYDFPAANRPILQAINLPRMIAIAECEASGATFMAKLEGALAKGAGLVQLRMKSQSASEWLERLNLIREQCPSLPVVVNSAIGRDHWPKLPGLHLTSSDLMAQASRPIGRSTLLGASCHSVDEVAQANQIGVDYITVSPVLMTASHPLADAIGWERFGKLVNLSRCPVYALGGLNAGHLDKAISLGGQGIAAIGHFWR